MKESGVFKYPPAPFSSQYATAVKHRGAVKIMNSFLEIWKSVQDYCKTQITEVAFNVWIAPLTLVRLDDSTALLTIEDTFKKKSSQLNSTIYSAKRSSRCWASRYM